MTAVLQDLDPLSIDMLLRASERLYGGEILPATPEVVQTRRKLIDDFVRDNEQPPDTMHPFALCRKCGLDNSERICAVLENFVTSSVDELIVASYLVAEDRFKKVRCKKCKHNATVYVDVHCYCESDGRDMVVRVYEGSEETVCSYQLLWMDRTGAFSHVSDDGVETVVIDIDADDLSVETIINLLR